MNFNTWFLLVIAIVVLLFMMRSLRNYFTTKRPNTQEVIHKVSFLCIIVSVLCVSYSFYKILFTTLTIVFLVIHLATWRAHQKETT